jgi:hypothetical protein
MAKAPDAGSGEVGGVYAGRTRWKVGLDRKIGESAALRKAEAAGVSPCASASLREIDP